MATTPLTRIFDQYRDAPLSELLGHLIANEDGVRPECVTPTYIQAQREKLVYPQMRFELGSRYGGYNTHGLTFLNRSEIEALRASAIRKADSILNAL